MRVLRVLHNLEIGGVQRQLLNLAPHLLKEMELHICSLGGGGALEASFEELGIKVCHVDLGWKYSPLGIAKLSRIISRGGYDLVHVHRMESIVFPVVVASLGAKVPVVVHHHFLYKWLSQRKKLLESWATRRALGVLAVSHPVMEHSCRELGIPPHRMMVVYNGVKGDRIPLKSRDPWLVGMVARMVRHKRVDTFLHAAARLVSIFPTVKFKLVGGGEREGRYRELAKELALEGKVVFTGSVLEVEGEAERFAIGVLPSENEGLPNTLLEYGALGLPMVASSIPQNREVVEEGREGLLVPAGDPNALAQALAALLLNRALAKRSEKMAKRRAEKFNLSRTKRNLITSYHRLLKTKVPSSSPEDIGS